MNSDILCYNSHCLDFVTSVSFIVWVCFLLPNLITIPIWSLTSSFLSLLLWLLRTARQIRNSACAGSLHSITRWLLVTGGRVGLYLLIRTLALRPHTPLVWLVIRIGSLGSVGPCGLVCIIIMPYFSWHLRICDLKIAGSISMKLDNGKQNSL